MEEEQEKSLEPKGYHEDCTSELISVTKSEDKDELEKKFPLGTENEVLLQVADNGSNDCGHDETFVNEIRTEVSVQASASSAVSPGVNCDDESDDDYDQKDTTDKDDFNGFPVRSYAKALNDNTMDGPDVKDSDFDDVSSPSKEKEGSEHEVFDSDDDSLLLKIETKQETDRTSIMSEDYMGVEKCSRETEFLGFDSASIEISLEKTNVLIQTLHNREFGFARTNVTSEGKFSSIDAAVIVPEEETTSVPDVSPISIETNQLIHFAGESNADHSIDISAEMQLKNAKKPNPVHPVLGVPVNIFDETVPSGSKRVKKKRKFFGDFEEPDGDKVTRKSSSSRPNEDGVKLLDNISGENKENLITDEKLKTDPVTENDGTSQNKVKRTYTFDISNPLFKEPFKYGWKREICYRNLPEGTKSKLAYVSYYSPQGQKFKTIRQIGEILPSSSELNMQHFTFSVQRIFNEPSEFEILRSVKSRTDLNDVESSNNDLSDATPVNQSTPQDTPSDFMKSISKKKQPTSSNRLMIKKPKYLKPAECKDEVPETSFLLSSTPTSTTPKIVIKGASLNSNKGNSSKTKSNSMKKDKKLSYKKQEKNTKKSSSSLDTVINSGREYSNSSAASIISKNVGINSACSISCPLALGSIPTLQCTICLNLYHFECCRIDASPPVHGYVCKSCRSRAEVQSKLLLVLSESSSSTLGYGGSNSMTTGSQSVTKNTTKIVDGVTTWLPPSSNVQLSSRHVTKYPATPSTPETTQATLLQSVLELDGKRYVIVPKESIVSISPNTNSLVSSYSGGFEERQSVVAQPLPIDPTARSNEATPNYVVNSSDVNSAGVLLVPVMPSGNDAYCNQIERGSSKRKLSEDSSDSSVAKIARLDGERADHRYRSVLTLSNIAQLYNPLTFCFKYLTVRDLLRVSMSCKYLNRIASEPSLWTTVRLKNSKVRDWEGFSRTLRKYGTKKLDMRKMLCPPVADDVNTMWNNFLEEIPNVISLEHIEFSRCNAHVVETVARSCPNLVVINSIQLRNGVGLSIENFAKLKHLRELRLKGLMGLNMEPCDELNFQSKEIMRVLSLTSIKNLHSAVVRALGDLSNLNILELGACNGEFMDDLAVSIGRLNNLQRLRLEQISNLDPHFKLFESLKNLPQLRSLELINIELRMGFCEAITACKNIENLLIIPLYKTESATSNRLIMDSLPPLSKSLKSFVWGLTYELIKATSLYATQYLDKPTGSNDETKGSPAKGPDSIPIVKRISKHPEVDILSVRNLEKMLTAILPQTRVKIITVGFALTWRQNLSDLLK